MSLPTIDPQASRRGFLRKIAGLAGAAAAATAIEHAEPVQATPEAPATPAPPPLSEPSRIQRLDRELSLLIEERDHAHAAKLAAMERFFDLCPPRPRELYASPSVPDYHAEFVTLEMNLGPDLQNWRPGSEERIVFDRKKLASAQGLYERSSARGRWISKRLALAERFERDAQTAIERSGYDHARTHEESLTRQIELVSRQILAIDPAALDDIRAHARAITAIAAQGHTGMWTYYGEPAPRVMAALLALPTAARSAPT